MLLSSSLPKISPVLGLRTTLLLRRIIRLVTIRLTLLHDADRLNVVLLVVVVAVIVLVISELLSKARNELKELLRVSKVVVESSPPLSFFFFLRTIFMILRGRPAVD